MATPNFVSGALSTVSELGQDEAWLQGWLRERPDRLGLGDLLAAVQADGDERCFVATDDDHCYSVDVQLGDLEAARGFGVLDNWARNRALHPDKRHVAVLVTETLGERYRSTLDALAEHLPLVVLELQVWKGESEAIVVPHVALSSKELDLAATPAARAATAVAAAGAEAGAAETSTATDTVASTDVDAGEFAEVDGADGAEAMDETDGDSDAEAEAVADGESDEGTRDKDDTGVGNPWGLPQPSGSKSLLSKVS